MTAGADSRKQVALRLSQTSYDQLQRACFIQRTSQSKLVEDALGEYCLNHNLLASYEVVIDKDCVALLKTGEGKPEILEMRIRNGVSPESLRERYSARLNAPVRLVVKQGDEP
jgi:hypothetical protein